MKNRLPFLCFAMIGFLAVSAAHAVDWNGNAGNNNFADVGNWSGNYNNTDLLYNISGANATLSSGTMTVTRFVAGNKNDNNFRNTLNITGGELQITSTSQGTYFGDNTNFTLNHSGGLINVTGNQGVFFNNGYYNISATTTGNLSGDGELRAPNSLIVLANQEHAVLNISENYRLSGREMRITSGAQASVGEIFQTGGQVSFSDTGGGIYTSSESDNNSAGAYAHYHLSGGKLSTPTFENRRNGTGGFYLSQGEGLPEAVANIRELKVSASVTGGTLNSDLISAGLSVGGGTVNVQSLKNDANVRNNTALKKAFLTGGTLNVGTIDSAVTLEMNGGVLNVGTLNGTLNQVGGTLNPGGEDVFGVANITGTASLSDTVGLVNNAINVALYKNAAQSSDYTNGLNPAVKATDGIYWTGDNNREFTHTAPGSNQWLEIDLGADFAVGGIHIQNRYTNGTRLCDGGFHFELTSESGDIYKSKTYDASDFDFTASPRDLDFSDMFINKVEGGSTVPANPEDAKGRYLRLVRDNPGSSGDGTTINVSQLEAYAYQEDRPAIQFDLGSNVVSGNILESDSIFVASGATLDISGADLLISFENDTPVAGSWQLFEFEDALTTDQIETILGNFDLSHLPSYANFQWGLADDFYTTGMLSLQATGGEVPEPGTWVLMLLSFTFLGFYRRFVHHHA